MTTDNNLKDIMFSRRGISGGTLGKCIAILKTTVPEELEAEFRAKAQQLGCTQSELLRDIVSLSLRGKTFGELTADERRNALDGQGTEKGLLSKLFRS